MMPQLGVLSTVHEPAATQVFDRDCLIRLGSVLAPVGSGPRGTAVRDGRAPRCRTADGRPAAVPFGELVLLPLPAEGRAHLVAAPERGFDLGAGKGRAARDRDARRRLRPDRGRARPAAVHAAGRRRRRASRAAQLESRARPLPAGDLTWRTPTRPGCASPIAPRLRRERRLPLKGTVLAAVGERVEAEQVVARCELPGNVQTLNLACAAGARPRARPGFAARCRSARAVRKDELIASARALFGLVRNTIRGADRRHARERLERHRPADLSRAADPGRGHGVRRAAWWRGAVRRGRVVETRRGVPAGHLRYRRRDLGRDRARRSTIRARI